MGVKISLISESQSTSIMVIDLLLIPVSRSNFRFELRFFHSCTSVVDVKVVNFCCTTVKKYKF